LEMGNANFESAKIFAKLEFSKQNCTNNRMLS